MQHVTNLFTQKKQRRQLLSSAFTAAALLTVVSAARAEEKVKLSGYVYAADGKQAVSNAPVAIYNSKNKEIASGMTDADGKYTLTVPRSALRLPVHHHSGGNFLGGLLKTGLTTLVSMANPLAGMGMSMASGFMGGYGHTAARGGMVSNVDSASAQQAISQMESRHLEASPELRAIAQGSSDAVETVTSDATGTLSLHVTQPGQAGQADPPTGTQANTPAETSALVQVYWLGEVTATQNGKTHRELQGCLDPVQFGANPKAEAPSLTVQHTLFVLREPKAEPFEVEYGQTVTLSIHMDTPEDPNVPVVVVAHNLKTNKEVELAPQGNGVYSVQIEADKSVFAKNEQLFCILAYAQDPQNPGRSKKQEETLRSQGLWKLTTPFAYDPLVEVSRNRVAIRVKVTAVRRP